MYSAVLDTCTLYPAYLRDTLLRCAAQDLFRPLWSADILDELDRNLSDLIGASLAARICNLLGQHFPDSIVTGYKPLIDAMATDLKDRHVLAAAVRGNADAVVTFNLKDFPASATDPYGVAVLHPDTLLLDLLHSSPEAFVSALWQQVAGYRNPRMRVIELAGRLATADCPGVAAAIPRHL